MKSHDIDAVLRDPQLLGAGLGDPSTWGRWLTILRAAFGLPLDTEQEAAFRELAGGRDPPTGRVRELWCAAGRRSGKSRVAAAIGAYLACFGKYRLAKGEIGHMLILAPTVSQSHVVFGYARSFIEASPILSQRVEEVRADEIRLTGNVTLGVHPASQRSVRGRTLIGVVLDEVAQFRDEHSSQPDIEIYRALLPALMTTGGMMVGISSPYMTRGLLYQKYKDAFGKDIADTLVVQAASGVLNPTLDAELLAKARSDDPEAARAELDAQFRGDLSSYIDRATLEACVDRGVTARKFDMQHRYSAHVDMSGGANDSACLAIAHKAAAADRIFLDRLVEVRAPHDPVQVVADFAKLLIEWRIRRVTADDYAAGFARSAFAQHGISLISSDYNSSELYLEALPLFTSGNAVLLDDARTLSQIADLERSAGRSSRDSVRHPRGRHDDCAVAACGSLVHCNLSRLSRPKHPLEGSARNEVQLGYSSLKKLYGMGRGRQSSARTSSQQGGDHSAPWRR